MSVVEKRETIIQRFFFRLIYHFRLSATPMCCRLYFVYTLDGWPYSRMGLSPLNRTGCAVTMVALMVLLPRVAQPVARIAGGRLATERLTRVWHRSYQRRLSEMEFHEMF